MKTLRFIVPTVFHDNEVFMGNMTAKQIEVMGMELNPTKKLVLLAILERPDSSRKTLSEFMNCDPTHLSTLTKKLVADGLLSIDRVEDSARVKYSVLV